MTIEELHDLLRSEFPNMNWKPKKQNKSYIVATVENREYLASIGQFADHVYNGAEYISIDFDSTIYGFANPIIGWEKAKQQMRENILKYDPKLLEEQQLTLF
jgi:hypothetical protein